MPCPCCGSCCCCRPDGTGDWIFDDGITDAAGCAAMGGTCNGSAPCNHGTCDPECSRFEDCIDGTCVDISVDIAWCGLSGTAVVAGAREKYVYVSGETTVCGDESPSGLFVDVSAFFNKKCGCRELVLTVTCGGSYGIRQYSAVYNTCTPGDVTLTLTNSSGGCAGGAWPYCDVPPSVTVTIAP